jgi:mRNA interferase YafQ
MYSIEYTNKMKRDVKRMSKRGKDLSKLIVALDLLASGNPIPAQYNDHPLKGELRGYRECHIEGDWLLIYQVFENRLILSASGTGTHSDLFDE